MLDSTVGEVGCACAAQGIFYYRLGLQRGGTPGSCSYPCCVWGPWRVYFGTDKNISQRCSLSITATPDHGGAWSTSVRPTTVGGGVRGSGPSCPRGPPSKYLPRSPHCRRAHPGLRGQHWNIQRQGIPFRGVVTYVRDYYLYVIGVVLGQVEVHYEPNVPPRHQVEAD